MKLTYMKLLPHNYAVKVLDFSFSLFIFKNLNKYINSILYNKYIFENLSGKVCWISYNISRNVR